MSNLFRQHHHVHTHGPTGGGMSVLATEAATH